MALTVDLRPGAQQAQAASSYFFSLAHEHVMEVIGSLHPANYVVEDEGSAKQALRAWSSPLVSDTDVLQLAREVRRTVALAQRVRARPGDEKLVLEAYRTWSTGHRSPASAFIELLDAKRPFTDREKVRASVGLRSGRIILVSLSGFVYSTLDDGACGLAIAGHGSYLFNEALPASEPVPTA